MCLFQSKKTCLLSHNSYCFTNCFLQPTEAEGLILYIFCTVLQICSSSGRTVGRPPGPRFEPGMGGQEAGTQITRPPHLLKLLLCTHVSILFNKLIISMHTIRLQIVFFKLKLYLHNSDKRLLANYDVSFSCFFLVSVLRDNVAIFHPL